MPNKIANALAKFDKNFVLEQVAALLDQDGDPMELVRELQAGMAMVGQKFETGEYYLAELMMSADLFMKAMALIEPRLEAMGAKSESIGKIVIGTPKGDLHDIGKNIFITTAKSAGFEVHDLGVDVPIQRFVEAVEEHKPDIVGFSALLTTTFQTMKDVVDALAEKDFRKDLKIAVGGGVTTEKVKTFLGADIQTIDAIDGINQCKAAISL